MPLPSAGAERRQHFRHELKDSAISVSFPTQNAFAKFYIRDVSTGGLFVRTSDRPTLNTLIQIRLEIPSNDSSQNLECFLSARVVRHGTDGIGLQIENTDLESRRRLESIVKKVAADEGLLARPEKREGVFERISNRRDIRNQRAKFFRKQSVAWLAVGILVALNLSVLTNEEIKESLSALKPSSASISPSIKIQLSHDTQQGTQHTITSTQNGLMEEPVNLNDLPAPLRKTIEGAQQMAPEARKSKTAPTSRVRLR